MDVSPSFGAKLFQPTLPARGATENRGILLRAGHISTHAPRTGSDIVSRETFASEDISTHAPRTGSDPELSLAPPARIISTHAPRTGSDVCRIPQEGRLQGDFNPRSPHGERPIFAIRQSAKRLFQPTLPARGATAITPKKKRTSNLFQPTLPARGATSICNAAVFVATNFNPRSPHGERLFSVSTCCL